MTSSWLKQRFRRGRLQHPPRVAGVKVTLCNLGTVGGAAAAHCVAGLAESELEQLADGHGPLASSPFVQSTAAGNVPRRQYRKNIPTCTSCHLNPTPQKTMSTEFKIDLYVKGYEEDHGSRTVSRGCIAARLSFMRCGPRHSRFVFVSAPMRSVYLRA